MPGRIGKSRNIWLVWLVWPLLTLGIYHLVWYYKVNREARDFDPRIQVEPMISVLAVTIGWVLIVPPFISVFNTGLRIGRMQESAGMRPTCNPVIGLVLAFFLSLHALYYQSELNRIWSHYQEPAEGVEVPLAA